MCVTNAALVTLTPGSTQNGLGVGDLGQVLRLPEGGPHTSKKVADSCPVNVGHKGRNKHSLWINHGPALVNRTKPGPTFQL
jgi:hypothetical protein